MNLRNNRGYSLHELVVVLATLGVVSAVSVPGYVHYAKSHSLDNAASSVASQIRQARAAAIHRGVDQPVLFETDSKGATFKTMNPDGTVLSSGRLPNSVMYDAATSRAFTIRADGSADHAGLIVLRDGRGRCDTVSVEHDGFVVSR